MGSVTVSIRPAESSAPAKISMRDAPVPSRPALALAAQ